jgi:hypothetical protein
MNLKILYQPLSSQSINERNVVVRKCEDRAQAMLEFCQEYFGDSLNQKTFLDIGSNYGYFLNYFKDYCLSVAGIENDSKKIHINKIFYPDVVDGVKNVDLAMFYEDVKYNIVSFLSILHNCMMSDEEVLSPEDYIEIVDEITEDVMFFEMGQEHEEFFQGTLDGWNPETIQEWILKNTTFDVCKPLMVDNDNVGRFENMFGRTLFACYRNDKDHI